MEIHKFFSWTCVLLWMALIFYLSHQPATMSNELSTGITEVIIEKVEKITPSVEFDIRGFNHIARKNAHFFNYLILGVLVMNALRRSGMQRYRRIGLTLFICVLYAISDETHQLFVPGRGAQVKDVFIDSSGAGVGIGIYLLFARIKKHNAIR
ncbi:VanZ family protein [Bacillus rhizoplanae]|uniref:VanZ family protein n=1 Tax=Bacillus rhizoplanae TaxID=2880966 RepID=UPI003D1B1ED0